MANEEKEPVVLAPSGVTFWNHRAHLVDGKLVLYWSPLLDGVAPDEVYGDVAYLRTFTKEETDRLRQVLNGEL